jgi:hypothetical protein
MIFKSEKKDRRSGDNSSEVCLPWWPNHDKPYHWLPKQGKAMSVVEYISQAIVKSIAWLPVYIAIVVTLTLAVLLWNILVVT